MKKDDAETAKKSYEKPALRSIELAAEEVLAVGCKMTQMPASGRPTCNSRPCAQKGS
jgi:hypothetical protein